MRRSAAGLRHRGACAALLALVGTLACGGDPLGPPPGAVLFDVEVSGEIFRVAVSDPAEVSRFMARLQSGARGVLNGPLRRGNGGFNSPWGWHLDPASVHLADAAIELCDGRPSMVEADLPYWIETVRQFCPWGARIAARIE